MDALMSITLLVLGFVGGFASGLLGIGGGILMTPLLLYVPPALGLSHLGIKTVAAMTMTQGLSGSLSGVAMHRKSGFVNHTLVLYMGVSIGATSLVGALASSTASDELLQGIFAAMALAAAGLMLKPVQERENCNSEEAVPSGWLASAIGAVVGFIGGMVGQGGAFIIIPLMLHVLKISTRVAIGSSLGVVFFSSTAGFAGKALTGQVPWLMAAALVIGVIPGARVGAHFSRRVRTPNLRLALAILIVATAVKIGWETVIG